MSQPEQPGARFRVYFDAALYPHRSLSRFGFFVVMSIAVGIGMTIGTLFMLAGAWPVMGFCGAELLLLYIAFRINYRAARRHERVVLRDGGLDVRRFGPKGEIGRWTFEPGWLRIAIDDPPRPESRLVVSSHGRSVTLGDFLSPAERFDFAQALRRAVEDYRRPPHLRDDQPG